MGFDAKYNSLRWHGVIEVGLANTWEDHFHMIRYHCVSVVEDSWTLVTLGRVDLGLRGWILEMDCFAERSEIQPWEPKAKRWHDCASAVCGIADSLIALTSLGFVRTDMHSCALFGWIASAFDVWNDYESWSK